LRQGSGALEGQLLDVGVADRLVGGRAGWLLEVELQGLAEVLAGLVLGGDVDWATNPSPSR
jgi:hypothetical protein